MPRIIQRGCHARHRVHTAALLCAVTLAGAPWAMMAQTTPATASADGPRRVLRKTWVPMWRAGGTPDDTLFGWVREHVADASQIYVLDAGTLELHAFSARDGAHRWSVGGRGSGPGQLKRPVDVALATGNTVGVLDPGNGRVSFYSTNGTFVRSVTVPEAAIANALCVFTDGSLLLLITSPSAFAVQMDSAGRATRRHGFPWPLNGGGNEFVSSATFIRGAPTGRCTAATTFGFGLAMFDESGAVRTVPFVERVAAPTFKKTKLSGGEYAIMLDKGDNAALGGWRSGETTFVSFAGATYRGGIVDLYDPGGRYLASWTAPPEDRMFYANRRLYGLSSGGATQKLRMWVDAADTGRVLREAGLRPRGSPRAVSRPARPADTPVRRPPPANAPR